MDAGSQIESFLSHVLSEVKDYIQGRNNNDGPAPNESLNSVEACVSLVDEAVIFLIVCCQHILAINSTLVDMFSHTYNK